MTKYVVKLKNERYYKGLFSIHSRHDYDTCTHINSAETFDSEQTAKDAMKSAIRANRREKSRILREINRANSRIKCDPCTLLDFYKTTLTTIEKRIENLKKYTIVEFKPEIMFKKRIRKVTPKWTFVKADATCSICSINFMHNSAYKVGMIHICPNCIVRLYPDAKRILDGYIEKDPEYMKKYSAQLVISQI